MPRVVQAKSNGVRPGDRTFGSNPAGGTSSPFGGPPGGPGPYTHAGGSGVGPGAPRGRRMRDGLTILKSFTALAGLALLLLLLGQVAGFRFLQNALVWLLGGAVAVLFVVAGVAAAVKMVKLGYRLLASLLLAGVLTFGLFSGLNAYAVTYDGFINKAIAEKLPPAEHVIYFIRRGRDYAPAFDEAERSASLDEVAHSPVLLAVIAVEDQRLNTRIEGPIDVISFVRAGFKTYVLRMRREGGSTVQVQLAKLLNGDLKTETLAEKARQSLIALRLEQRFGDENHDKLVTLYLNVCQIDGRTVGAAGAAANLFGVSDLRVLTLSQAALLAGMLRSPSKFDPRRDPRLATERRNLVLSLMRDQGMITEEQFAAASKEEIRLQPALKKFELYTRAARAVAGQGRAS